MFGTKLFVMSREVKILPCTMSASISFTQGIGKLSVTVLVFNC